MPEQLHYELKESLQNYYTHRQRQSRNGWDKESDLDLIFRIAKREGWSTEAVAGHFWFRKKVLLGTHIIEVTENTLPKGGISNITDNKTPYGVFSLIATAYKNKKKKVDKESENAEPKEGNYI